MSISLLLDVTECLVSAQCDNGVMLVVVLAVPVKGRVAMLTAARCPSQLRKCARRRDSATGSRSANILLLPFMPYRM